MYRHPLIREVMAESLPLQEKLHLFEEVIDASMRRFGEIGITPSPLEGATHSTRVAWLIEVTDNLLTHIYDGAGPVGEEREQFVEVLLSNKQYMEDVQEIFRQQKQPMFYAMSLN